MVALTLSINSFCFFCFFDAPALCMEADAIFEVNRSSSNTTSQSGNCFSSADFNNRTFSETWLSSLLRRLGIPSTNVVNFSFCLRSTKKVIKFFDSTVSKPNAKILLSSEIATPVRFKPKSRLTTFPISAKIVKESIIRHLIPKRMLIFAPAIKIL